MAAYGGLEKEETDKFILLMNRFIDCLNVRALQEGDHKRNPDLMPYRSVTDSRFIGCHNTILRTFDSFGFQMKRM